MFRGSIVALATPLKNDEVDLPKLRDLVEFHIAAGTHGIVAAGTTGEAGTLSEKEKLLVIQTVVEQARERIPVIGGTASNSTKACIELTQAAMQFGVHAALIMTPAYIKPTQEGLYQHYKAIASAVGIPIILYNVPSRTACDIEPETIKKLAKISNIVGIKDATAQLSRLQSILNLCEGSMDVYSGDDITAAEWMLSGAKGVISVTANVAARLMAKLADTANDNNQKECLAINEQLMPLHRLLFVESNPIPVKWALSRMGLMNNELRLPLTSLLESHQKDLEQILKKLDIIS